MSARSLSFSCHHPVSLKWPLDCLPVKLHGLECWGEDLVHKRPEPVNQLRRTKKGLCSHLSITHDRHIIIPVAMEKQEAPLTRAWAGQLQVGNHVAPTNQSQTWPQAQAKQLHRDNQPLDTDNLSPYSACCLTDTPIVTTQAGAFGSFLSKEDLTPIPIVMPQAQKTLF